MVDRYDPKPIEERESRKLGPKEFVINELPIMALPFVGGAIAFGLGMAGVLKGRSIIAKAHNWYQRARGHEQTETVQNVLNAGYELYGIKTPYAKAQANNVFNGVKLGAVGSLFLGWQKKEEAKLDLIDVHEALKEVEHLHLTNDDLRKDNHLMRKQIDFMRQQRGEEPVHGHDYPTARINSVRHESKLAEERSLQIGS